MHQENVYHLHPNRNFREFVVNGKQPLKLAATRGRPALPRSLKPRVDQNFLETPRGTDRNSLVNLRGTDTNFATLLNSPCQQLNGHFRVAWEKKKVIFISMAWYLATFWNRGLGNSEIAYCNHTSKKTKNRDAKGHQKWSLFLSFFSVFVISCSYDLLPY